MPAPAPASCQDVAGLTVAPVDKATAREVLVANHYSHKWQTTFGVRNYGVFDGPDLLGVASYGHPMNPQSWPSVTRSAPDRCIELNRLWIDDRLGANTETWLLAQTFRHLRDDGFELVQSFADGRLGVGTIYQAANFTYHGAHTTTFHRSASTGTVYHGTPFSNTAVFRSMLDRNEGLATGDLSTFRVQTYRYLYPLTKTARRAVRLPVRPYPKARDGITDLPDYTPPPTQIARCVALCEALDDPRLDAFRAYLATLTPDPDALVEVQRANRWVAAIRAKRAEATD